MFNERTALEILFRNLEASRENRYNQYLEEIRQIELKQVKLLEDLKRIDAESHIHSELIEAKREEMAALRETKKNLATMDQTIVAQQSKPVAIPETSVAKSTLDESKPARITESATKPIIEDGKKTYPDGTETYQAFYICPSCKERKRIFVTPATKQTHCRGCNKKVEIRHAMKKGFPHRDGYGNYFVGGEFIREEDRMAHYAGNPVSDALTKYNAERAAQIAEGSKRAEEEAAAATTFTTTTNKDWPEEETAIAAAFKESAKFHTN